MGTIRRFGDKKENIQYVERHAAYVVISDDEREKIILVQAPNGAYFLPGGEIEGKETREEAVHREVMEELGFKIELGAYLGRGDEYFYSRHRDTYYHNPGYFYVVKKWKRERQPLEDFNVIKWFSVEEGIEKLKRGSHKWAVRKWYDEK